MSPARLTPVRTLCLCDACSSTQLARSASLLRQRSSSAPRDTACSYAQVDSNCGSTGSEKHPQQRRLNSVPQVVELWGVSQLRRWSSAHVCRKPVRAFVHAGVAFRMSLCACTGNSDALVGNCQEKLLPSREFNIEGCVVASVNSGFDAVSRTGKMGHGRRYLDSAAGGRAGSRRPRSLVLLGSQFGDSAPCAATGELLAAGK